MQNHWFFFDDLCVDDSQNFNVGDLITSLDHPERHGKAKVCLREGEKEKNHQASAIVANNRGPHMVPPMLNHVQMTKTLYLMGLLH